MAEIRGQHTNRWGGLEAHREQRGGCRLECRVLTVFIRQGIRVLCRGGRGTRGKVCLWCRESTQASSRTSPDHDRIFNWDKASERAQIIMGRGRRDRMLGVGTSSTPRDQSHHTSMSPNTDPSKKSARQLSQMLARAPRRIDNPRKWIRYLQMEKKSPIPKSLLKLISRILRSRVVGICKRLKL